MSKALHIVHIVAVCLLLASLACNVCFIRSCVCNNRQARQSSARIESEFNDAAGSVSSATSTIKQVSTGLGTVATGLRDSQSTAEAIKDKASTSIERCGDIEQTIKELRSQLEDLERNCNSSNSDSDGLHHSLDNNAHSQVAN